METGEAWTLSHRNISRLYNEQISVINEKVDVDGPLCLVPDILARDVTIKNAEIGDLVVVKLSGAYGLSMAATGFLSHPTAQEYCFK